MEFARVLASRRMVRNYLPEPVDPATIERIVEAGLSAPSAGFAQGQRYLVVTEPERRRAIAELAGEPGYVARGFDPWLSRAPVHLLVMVREGDYHQRYAEPDKSGSEWPVPYWHVDAGAGLMAILLATVNEGLAAGFLGCHRLEGIQALLEVPEDFTVIGLVTIGRPAPDRRSGSLARGKRPDRVRWEHWGG
ncbi:MAG: nitroreductase family protein [Candidatus Eremiobacteraeota bacterium]|nr:nitroreductase family protein [Candidatus Eremiobacteraeota bacterium]